MSQEQQPLVPSGFYYIQNVQHSDLVLDSPYSNPALGGNIIGYPKNQPASNNQKWEVKTHMDQKSGFMCCTIKNMQTGKLLQPEKDQDGGNFTGGNDENKATFCLLCVAQQGQSGQHRTMRVKIVRKGSSLCVTLPEGKPETKATLEEFSNEKQQLFDLEMTEQQSK